MRTAFISAVNGTLLALERTGVLRVVEATPSEYKELFEWELPFKNKALRAWEAPVYYDQKIYCKKSGRRNNLHRCEWMTTVFNFFKETMKTRHKKRGDKTIPFLLAGGQFIIGESQEASICCKHKGTLKNHLLGFAPGINYLYNRDFSFSEAGFAIKAPW